MSEHFASWDDATLELAADLVTEGLDPADVLMLEAQTRREDLEAFEMAVAQLSLGGLDELVEPPAHVLASLQRSATAWNASAAAHAADDDVVESRVRQPIKAPFSWAGVGGWLAAAALLIALFALQRGGSGPSADPAEQLDALVASAGDLVRHGWKTTEDPDSPGVTGEVVWSSASQEGYMRFQGLRRNDPTRKQYQLWIFDQTRAEWDKKPVDGGVFDVDDSGEAIVPIDPKLPVREAVLFAITLEQPGGVVVSERERLVLLSESLN